MRNGEEIDRGSRQLRRLEMLTDVVYALVIFRLFLMFRLPQASEQSFGSVIQFLDSERSVIGLVAIGVLLTSIHWIRSNAAFGMLARTDNRHSFIAILQLMAVLFFLYTVRLGAEFEGDRLAMIMESAAAALMGYVGLVSALYASRSRRLLAKDATLEEAKKLSRTFLIEPVTATLAIGFAFLGNTVWTLSWFVVGPLVAFVVRKVWK
jgi:uncharacterized membrane protein